MTPAELTAIRERVEQATEGPWAAWYDQDGQPHMQGRLMVGNADAVIPDGKSWVEGVDINPVAECLIPEDREFIVHARENVPALLDLVDTLTKRLEAVRELADMWAATGDPATKERQAALKGAARRLYQALNGD